MNKIDVMIVGTGAAGLFCALRLPEHVRIHMITKDQVENSDSFLAQGGISTLRDPQDYEAYFEDTMKAGHYKNQRESVQVMIQSSPKIIQKLIDYGVDFAHTEEGLIYTREGGHSQARILHHKDITGWEITSKLLEQVKQRKNITIEEHTTMIDLICENNCCKGVIVKDQNKEIHSLPAKVVVFATGGIGGLFKHSTNFSHITGDALAIAINHDVALQDIHYIQIHPTAFFSKNVGRSFLISEAVRGEGAILLNEKRERFVNELLPRDVVAAAIKEQMVKYGMEYVYLSMENLEEKMIKERFPNIYKHCLEEGFDLTKECIPVTPAQHYFMGGIKVDLSGMTTMDNLFAVGETSCNGVHGANRLGSNSLLESLVFSERAADVIMEKIDSIPWQSMTVDLNTYQDEEIESKYRKIVLNEIKRRDINFYEQWCNDEN